MMARRRPWKPILLLALFLAAFVPRALYPVSRPLQWYERSFRFVDAVLHGQWADTVVSEHPGVTSMWLIGLAQHGSYALRQALGGSPPHPLDIDGRAFQTEVVVSILPLALAIAGSVLLTWWLLKCLFGEKAAWAGAGLMALDPFHIAISKVVHVDALLSVLMILSALTLLVYLRRSEASGERRPFWSSHRLLVASGVLAGFAFLTKSPAYFLVPFLGLSLLAGRGRARLWKGYLVPGLIWSAAAAVTYVALWPAMWVQPGQTLATVIGGVFKHTGQAHPQPLYYLGELVTEDPGPGFYGVTLLVKTTVLSLPLLIVGLVGPLTATWRRERRSLGLLIAYLVFFFIQMGLGAKKAPRYLLPAFPALDIIAGVGLATLACRLASWKARVPSSAVVAAALAVQAALVWPYHPYYITHASLLVGGPAGAQRLLLPTPEGEGLDLVARYLNHLPDASRLRVGVQMPAWEAFRQYFVGEVVDTREPDLDYVVFADVYVTRHVAEDQWGKQWETYRYRVPEYTASLHGLPYAWLYRVDEGPQEPAVSLPVCMGEHVRLLGYTLVVDGAIVDSPPLDGQVLQPGDSLLLTLHWAATGSPEGDYSVFVHLLGPDGAMLTQQDNPPLHGTFPTFLWEAGERLDDPYELTVPLDAPPGPYTLSAGMYDWRTGERLEALADCDTPLPENRVTLATFEVRRGRVPWWQVLACGLGAVLALGGLVAARPRITVNRKWVARWWMPLTYLLLTLVMTYPAVFRLGTHYIGASTDLWMFPWNDWWLRDCLLEGHSPFYTTRIFYPYGVSTVYHNFAWLNTATWMPLSSLIGPIAAHNLIFLFNLALAGVGMHLFVHYLTQDHRAALLAGVIFSFWPYRMSHFNHPNMISVGWVPFCMLYLVRAIREETKLRFALLAGLFYALTGIARWMHLIYTSGLIVVYLVYSVLLERRFWNWRTVTAVLIMLGVAVTLVSPLLSPLVAGQIVGGEEAEDVFVADGDYVTADLVSYFVPERGHPLFRSWLGELWSRMRRGSYVGYTALALAGVGLISSKRQGIPWLVAGAGLFILALGGTLQVAGHKLNVALPYSWVQDWFPVRVMRHPHRFNILLSFPLAVLAGYGVTLVLPRLRRPAMCTVGLCALILIEYLPWPYPTIRPTIPPFYYQLAQEPDDFAILELPLKPSTAAKEYMYYATLHNKPLVGGKIARLPSSAFAFIDSIPLLYGLHADEEMDPDLGDVSRQLSALAQANVRYVILHPDGVPPDRLARWREWLAVEPAYEDAFTVVYRTVLEHGRDFSFEGMLGDGIGVIDARISKPDSPQSRALGVRVVWGTEEAPGRDWRAQVALVAHSGAEVLRVSFEPCADWPTSQWGENAVARGRGTVEIDPALESGTFTVTLALVDGQTGTPAGASLAIGQVELP
jgi:4-amino-4-deoxy-L-arabinose transferase-like glycosyltransferase